MRAVIVGEAPSRTSDPALPLSGRSGKRLSDLLGFPVREGFDVLNLLPAWPGKAGAKGSRLEPVAAREAAGRLLPSLVGRKVVFLGDRVRRAFCGKRLKPLTWRLARGAPGALAVAMLPHPSGVNRWWNDGKNARAARTFLRREAVRG